MPQPTEITQFIFGRPRAEPELAVAEGETAGQEIHYPVDIARTYFTTPEAQLQRRHRLWTSVGKLCGQLRIKYVIFSSSALGKIEGYAHVGEVRGINSF